MRILAITLLCVLALAACDLHKDKKEDTLSNMIYSPNGDPLNGGPLGRPTCVEAMNHWFDRVSEGGGNITKIAFLADAQTQFTRMDIDHNGYIVSEELDRFREPYRQQPSAHKQGSDDSSSSQGGDGHGGGHKGKGGGGSGTPSDPSLTSADPVMSADTNLDFKVTPQEFMKHAEDNFARLDANHDGVIDRSEIATLCDKPKE